MKIYARHWCTELHNSFKDYAKCALRAKYVYFDGRYAEVYKCNGQTTVVLRTTAEAARSGIKGLCMADHCSGQHEVVKLGRD